MIIGIDLGNVNVKTSSRTIYSNRHTTDEKLYEDADNLRMEFDGQRYVMGAGEYQTNYQKAKKDDILLNLYTAIALSSADTMNQVVVGLPVQQYKSDKEYLEKLINENRIKEFIINDRYRKIIITECRSFPEGLATYYSLSQELRNDIGNRDIVIIDMGGRTTDICLYSMINGIRKLIKYATIPAGTLNIYSDFVQAVNSRYGLDKLKEDAELILKEGLWVDGEKVSLQHTKPIFEKYGERILSELRLNYPIRTAKVLICGGGGTLLRPIFSREIKGITVIDDIFCNAAGFKRVGESIWNLSQ